MKIWIYRSFIREKEGGNGAGLCASLLSEDKMQAMAKEVGLSETVFLGDGPEPTLRFFTPTGEVDLCGHALIAALAHLDAAGKMPSRVLTKAGRIETSKEGARYWMRQPAAQFFDRVPLDDVLGMFDLPREAYRTDPAPQIISTGLSDLFVGVGRPSALYGARPDVDRIKALSEKWHTVGVHLYCVDKRGALVRNFAPLYGIDEEAATGTSNGALAALLHKNQIAQGLLDIRQGDGMGKPSTIFARIGDDGHPLVGGMVICEGLWKGEGLS